MPFVIVHCCLFLLRISFGLSGDMNKDNISWPAVIYICVAINEVEVMLLSKLMQTIISGFLSYSKFHVISHADLHLQQVLILHVSWACKDRC